MTKEISKTWNTGLPTVVGSRKARWMNKINLHLVVAPFIIKWGVTVGMSTAMSLMIHPVYRWEYHWEYNNWYAIKLLIMTLELACSYFMGRVLCHIYRFYILYKLLSCLKKSGDTGQKISETVAVFIEDLCKGNGCLIPKPLFRAIRAAGTLELDNIMSDLKGEDKPSPMLRWRIITWSEKFGNEVSQIFDYDLAPVFRKQSGWWAETLLPRRGVGEWDVNIRQPILEALPFADPDEGARLSAFIAEAATVKESDMSDQDKVEFMALSNQAREMADNILAAQALLPIQDRKNGLANSMINIRRILSEDSANAPSVSTPVEHVLLANSSPVHNN